MAAPTLLPRQASLFDELEPEVSAADRLAAMERLHLDSTSWIDHLPGFLHGADETMDAVARSVPWTAPVTTMYNQRLRQPRLSAILPSSDERLPATVRDCVAELDTHYGITLTTVGANLYRDGNDSVAWHGDRDGTRFLDTVVILISLGARRSFLVRPRGGGPARRWDLGHGDLLTMGGACQQNWEHCVPKRRSSGPRLSLGFRPAGVL